MKQCLPPLSPDVADRIVYFLAILQIEESMSSYSLSFGGNDNYFYKSTEIIGNIKNQFLLKEFKDILDGYFLRYNGAHFRRPDIKKAIEFWRFPYDRYKVVVTMKNPETFFDLTMTGNPMEENFHLKHLYLKFLA